MSNDKTLWLHHKKASVFTYEIAEGQDFRAILISDLHIARFCQNSESISQICDHLREIINEKNANIIFICGDIIHFKLSVRYFHWLEAYSKFDELGVEIHVIPGNHDRFKHKKVSEYFHGANVHLHSEELIKIVPPNGRAVVLGHDVHNDRRVHGTKKIRMWFRSLRNQFNDIIGADSLLILGHLHEDEISEDGLTKSLMPYSYDLHVFFYGFLSLNSNQEIDAEFIYQEGSVETMII